eukprot:TRINITY_DN33944_c0_g1_i1.p1 TRINITY_DN33944_c0_g1~~TRINITY_DN33944_c0_g1_i1.p1  ORF type:complete len:379 (-),score=5.49 TRINITY_DN33944_c0_g1_i1:269-1405(-)
MDSIDRAIIVGGGIGGMVAAISLAKRGIEVHVIEAGRREDQLGTGINLQNNALRALDEAGLLDDCLAEGFSWETITNRTAATGEIINSITMPWPKVPGIPGAMGIMRTSLAEILARHAIGAGVKISYKTKVTALEQDDSGVTVELSDETTDKASFLIAADGAYSQIRQMVFGDKHKPFYAGQGAWRFTIPRPKTLDGFTMFRTSDGVSLGFLPLAPDIAYYFYLETTEKPLRVPPDEAIDMLAKRLSVYDVPEVRELVPLMREGWHVSYRPFDILLMPKPWNRGRVVLLGDAAHSLTPQLTSGGGMAIEDAVVLADEIAKRDSVQSALQAYSARRYDRVQKVYESSLRICEIEKGRSNNGAEGTQVLIEGLQHLAARY